MTPNSILSTPYIGTNYCSVCIPTTAINDPIMPLPSPLTFTAHTLCHLQLYTRDAIILNSSTLSEHSSEHFLVGCSCLRLSEACHTLTSPFSDDLQYVVYMPHKDFFPHVRSPLNAYCQMSALHPACIRFLDTGSSSIALRRSPCATTIGACRTCHKRSSTLKATVSGQDHRREHYKLVIIEVQ